LRLLTALIVLGTWALPARSADRPLEVWVSIPPELEIVERVGGDLIRVHSLTEPGDSPHTFEPTPRQLAALWEADLYLRIGVPFEAPLLERVEAMHPELSIGDLSQGIDRARMLDHAHAHHSPSERLDPHIWLDPMLVEVAAATARDELCRLAPDSCRDFDHNLASYIDELEALSGSIAALLDPYRGRRVYVFHPAYGYLLRRYGLEQVAVEVGGKEPTPRQLAQLVGEAEGSGSSVLFVQPQLQSNAARAVADTLGWRLEELDPLAPDLSANLERMARRIADALGGSR
jgi:zinc transport system substrate-binding protein